MNIQDQIERYVSRQAEPKCNDLRVLHSVVLELMPGCRLWFLDGKNSDNKTVSNPSIGYGFRAIKYADGKTRDFYQIGISANTAGLSVYVMGIKDKDLLSRVYGQKIGRASVSGYCVKFKKLEDIDTDILRSMMQHGIDS